MSRRSIGPDQQTDPGSNIYAVTKNDTTNDPNGPFRGIVFGGAGGELKYVQKGTKKPYKAVE